MLALETMVKQEAGAKEGDGALQTESMSAQRRSSRKRAASSRVGDMPDSSPSARSQPAKRRKGPSNKKLSYGEMGDHDTEDDANVEREEEPSLEDENQELTDLVTRYLDIASEPVAAADAYRPEMWDEQNVQAFAKISGRKWTYFVREVRIILGRRSEDVRPSDPEKVHIDLGPNKMISRLHAELYFDSETESWNISVHGRNGVRVNERQVRRNEVHRVESGDVLAIAGTQMLFQLAGVKMRIHNFFMDKISAAQIDETPPESSSARRPELAQTPLPPIAQMNGSVPPVPCLLARPRTPDTIAKMPPTSSIKRRSPSNKKGMLIESTEQIDYALESSKDIKPGCSYAAMITWAILSTVDEAISLNGIYQWIKDHYAFYRLSQSGWQNSIRHNLSLNQNFRKVPRRPDEPGKGMKWTFVPENREATIIAANKNASKGGGRLSSAPASPASAPAKKLSPSQRTPPLSSIPAQSSAQTPSFVPRGSNSLFVRAEARLPVLSDENSPMPRRTNGHLTIQGSSPTLTSGVYGSNDLPMHTPAPRAYNLHVPQPNTVKLPTSHMTDSSPAPFWKPLGPGIGQTPARWPDSSPQKPETTGKKDGVALSSSPPPIPNGPESPTRMPISSQRAASTPAPVLAPIRPPLPPRVAGEDDDADSGIDLMRGFTKISTFHQMPQRNPLPPPQMRFPRV